MARPLDEPRLPYDAKRHSHTFPPEVVAQISRMAEEGRYEIRGRRQ